MPNFYDFTNLKGIKKIEVNPDGWVNPLNIEYGIGQYGEVPSYFWRIEGTKHTFVIPIIRIDFLSEGNYVKHFTKALEGFREDYKGWAKEGFYSKWMQEYRDEYSRYISV